MKKRNIALFILTPAVFLGSLMAWAYMEAWEYREYVNVSTAGNYRVYVWSERDVFDLDSRWPSIYYGVFQGQEPVAYPTWMRLVDQKRTYQFEAAFADNRNLACVCERSPDLERWEGVVMVFHAPSQECWPRCFSEGESDKDPFVRLKWLQRYSQLKAENPNLPEFPPFEYVESPWKDVLKKY